LGTISEDAPEVFEKPLDSNSGFAIDANLNDTEKIPMKQDIDEYFEREVLPFAPDAWMEREKDKVGCEFPFTRIFYIFRPLRSTQAILDELIALDGEMENELKRLKEEV
jgi:type I restriction enzyme M protein